MRVVVVRPGEKPEPQDIGSDLSSMQELVGGTIQVIYPFQEPVALVCNDEGKLLGLPLNRALRDEDGRIYDVVAGTFFLCAAPPDSEKFESLSEQQERTLTERFTVPEIFLAVGSGLMVLPGL